MAGRPLIKEIEKPTVDREAGGGPDAEDNEAENGESGVDHSIDGAHVINADYHGSDVTRDKSNNVKHYSDRNRHIRH